MPLFRLPHRVRQSFYPRGSLSGIRAGYTIRRAYGSCLCAVSSFWMIFRSHWCGRLLVRRWLTLCVQLIHAMPFGYVEGITFERIATAHSHPERLLPCMDGLSPVPRYHLPFLISCQGLGKSLLGCPLLRMGGKTKLT